VAASLAGGEGIEAAELAIRAGLTSLGRGVLEDLLTADAGYRGPRIGCGTGHQAEFVSCRPKTVDTVLGPVTVNRAWYHCAACGHGLAPRDAELGVAGETMSPGLAKMAARAAEAVPFTRGAGLVGALAGIQLTGKRLGRHAEADGRAAAAVIEAEAAAIAARTDRHLTTTRTQTIQARLGYRSVTYILVPHPFPDVRPRVCCRRASLGNRVGSQGHPCRAGWTTAGGEIGFVNANCSISSAPACPSGIGSGRAQGRRKAGRGRPTVET
jgi:hypothetical protein